MDAVMLARIQFAFTIGYHFIFVPISIGVGLMVVFAERRYYKSGIAADRAASNFWIKLFTATFAIGVSPGVPARPRGMSCSSIALRKPGWMPTLISLPSTRILASPPVRGWVRRVWISPNATQLTLTLYRPHSLHKVWVNPITPAFAAE